MSTTGGGTLEVVELDESLLEANLKCNIRRDEECDKDAAWGYLCILCFSGRHFACEVHRALWLRFITSTYAEGGHTHCAACGSRLTEQECLASMTRL